MEEEEEPHEEVGVYGHVVDHVGQGGLAAAHYQQRQPQRLAVHQRLVGERVKAMFFTVFVMFWIGLNLF